MRHPAAFHAAAVARWMAPASAALHLTPLSPRPPPAHPHPLMPAPRPRIGPFGDLPSAPSSRNTRRRRNRGGLRVALFRRSYSDASGREIGSGYDTGSLSAHRLSPTHIRGRHECLRDDVKEQREGARRLRHRSCSTYAFIAPKILAHNLDAADSGSAARPDAYMHSTAGRSAWTSRRPTTSTAPAA